MQPRQQHQFFIILYLLFSLADCQEQAYVKSVKFTNKLFVDVTVTAVYHGDPLTDENGNETERVRIKIAAGADHTFRPIRLGSGFKPIRKIETDAAGDKDSCDVQLFAVGVTELVKLGLAYRPEDEDPKIVKSDDWERDYGGQVNSVEITNKLRVTASVTCFFSAQPLTQTDGESVTVESVQIEPNEKHRFFQQRGDSHIPLRRIEVDVDKKKAACNVDKRYGNDVVNVKRLEIVQNGVLGIPELQEPTATPTTGSITTVAVFNYLKQSIYVRARRRSDASSETTTSGVLVAPGTGTKIEYRTSSQPSFHLHTIEATFSSVTRILDVDGIIGHDDVIQKNLKLVYETTE